MKKDLAYYSERLARLHTDKNRNRWTAATDYRAPHKMFLLMSLMELIEVGEYENTFIEITPGLLDTFNRYWSTVMPLGTRGNLLLPFFHMRSEGYWFLKARPGKESIADAMRRCDSFKQFTDVYLGAEIEEDLYSLMRNRKACNDLRTILLTYFDDDIRGKLIKTIRENRKAYEYSEELLRLVKNTSVGDSKVDFKSNKVEPRVRDQGFRKAVVSVYEHRCAICGIRMLTPSGHTAVDASHIVPWSESHNDDIRNGLCLCKICHWAFDELLVTISEKYKIKTSPLLETNSNLPGHFPQLADRDIIKPSDKEYYPGLEFLHDHQKRFSKLK